MLAIPVIKSPGISVDRIAGAQHLRRYREHYEYHVAMPKIDVPSHPSGSGRRERKTSSLLGMRRDVRCAEGWWIVFGQKQAACAPCWQIGQLAVARAPSTRHRKRKPLQTRKNRVSPQPKDAA